MNASASATGGAIYIFGQDSALDLVISNTEIDNIRSRYRGGLIYLDPGRNDYKLTFKNNNISNVYSMQGAFIYSTFLSKALVNFEYNNIFNDYESTKNFL